MALSAPSGNGCDASEIKDTVQSRGARVGEKAQSAARDAADSMKDKYSQLRETASDYAERGRDSLASAERTVEEQIGEHPIAAVLIGVGIGLAIGLIVARR
jgi:ElaB/YqjD/DUF883 family membrane-anchored ribosome-binding protein